MNYIEAINRLKKEKGAMILAHHYQCEEVKQVADHIGDSLEMAKIAAASPHQILVICGVYFMAETAKILSPEKTVLLPNMGAGCPMADMVTAEALIEKKKEYPNAKVVCYVNSPAEVKAHSDICCTSSNAEAVVNSLEGDEILFVPDQNLAYYVSTKVPKKTIIPWKGFCPTHHRMTTEEVFEIKKLYPQGYFMAHPECRKEVLEMADFIGSTSQIIQKSKTVDVKDLIIGTEEGVIETIRTENPHKNVVLLHAAMVCPNMKKTRIEDVLNVLQTGENEIVLEENIIREAFSAIDKMMKVK